MRHGDLGKGAAQHLVYWGVGAMDAIRRILRCARCLSIVFQQAALHMADGIVLGTRICIHRGRSEHRGCLACTKVPATEASLHPTLLFTYVGGTALRKPREVRLGSHAGGKYRRLPDDRVLI